MSDTGRRALDVVAAVIRRNDGPILICLRPPHLDQGGLWEFPGGKREPGESRLEALARELNEELGINVRSGTPLLRLTHAYPEKDVCLDVWDVADWRGVPTGRESQIVRWVEPGALDAYEFPAANSTIVTAVRLPRALLMPSARLTAEAGFILRLEQWFRAGFSAVVLPACAVETTAASVALAATYDATVHITDPALAGTVRAGAGRHLSPADLRRAADSGAPPALRLSASVSSAADFRLARQIGVDWIVMTGEPGEQAASVRELPTDLRDALEAAKVPTYKTAPFDIREHADVLRGGFQGVVVTDEGLAGRPVEELAGAFRRSLAAASVAR